MSSLQSNLLENHTPTGREEAWRFTPLKRLGGLHDGSATVDTRHSLVVSDALEAGVTFIFGALVTASPSTDLIVNRIRNHTEEGSVLSIAKNSVIANPIRLSRSNGSLTTAEFSRFQIHLGEHAQATVILENTGDTHLAEDLGVVRTTWLMSGFMASMAGVFSGMTPQMHPELGSNLLLSVFAAAIFGGVGSLPGAVIGGFLVGIAENLFLLVANPGYKPAMPFLLLLGVLWLRPQGLLGEKSS